MARILDHHECYACGRAISPFRALLGSVDETFESAFDGPIRAAFCSRDCKTEATANAAAVRKSFPPPPPDHPIRHFSANER